VKRQSRLGVTANGCWVTSLQDSHDDDSRKSFHFTMSSLMVNDIFLFELDLIQLLLEIISQHLQLSTLNIPQIWG
jgi:hypothetical protein